MLLGNQPTIGAFYNIDDISSGFDGIETSFPTTVGGLTRLLGKPANCIIVVNGVIQAPDTAFTVTASTINFVTPPDVGDSFWGVILGNVHVFSNIYEKFEIDGAMAGKSDTSHVHDDRYYTESEIDANTYTQTQTDSLLNEKVSVVDEEVDTMVINGFFDVWQRNVSGVYTDAGAFVSDRWYVGSTYDTISVSQEAFPYAQTEVPNHPTYYTRCIVTNSAGDASSSAYMLQRIINPRIVSGKRIAVSFWARSPTHKNIGVSHSSGSTEEGYDQSYQGSPVTLSELWQKYTIYIDFPSLLGTTLMGRRWAEIRFWFSAGSDYNYAVQGMTNQTGTFDISNVEVYPSSVELPVRRKSEFKELWDCQKYYQKSYDRGVFPGTSTATGAKRWRMTDWSNSATYVTIFDCPLVRPMIITPNIALYSRMSATPGRVYDEAATTDLTASAVNINTKSFQVYPNRTSTALTLRDLSYHFTAEGEL